MSKAEPEQQNGPAEGDITMESVQAPGNSNKDDDDDEEAPKIDLQSIDDQQDTAETQVEKSECCETEPNVSVIEDKSSKKASSMTGMVRKGRTWICFVFVASLIATVGVMGYFLCTMNGKQLGTKCNSFN